ncbi:hypothetical protein REPUB_Repub17cG0026100 [Reevesia pubescens]
MHLSKKEIEEDFMLMAGHRPLRRPKKQTHYVQKQLDSLFPGLWLTEVTVDIYKVPELVENDKKPITKETIHQIAKSLVSSLLSVKVIQAEEAIRKLIFSEKEAVWTKFSTKINIGDIFEDFFLLGKPYYWNLYNYDARLYYLTGLVHVLEVSWDLVQDVRDILTKRDDVRVKVIHIDR